MTQKENNTVNTDRAWHIVYSRLKQDGLLPQEITSQPTRLFRPSVIGWVAAVFLLCLGMATVLFLRGKDPDIETSLLTLHNEKGSVTLVKTLEDGSVVYLSDDTRLQYPEHFLSDKRMVKLQGSALFDVVGHTERPFFIETEQTRIEVIGTSFKVKSANHIPFELSVERGEVKVTWKKNGESTYVKGGETVVLASGGLRVEPTEDASSFYHFTERIRFKDETMGNILHIINKWSSGTELEATPSLANRKITVSFGHNSPEAIAELLCTAFNLTYEKVNGKLLISEP